MSLLTNVQAAVTSTGSAASGAGGAQHPNPMMNTLLMIVVFGLFIYFLLWRPQNKRVKEHRNLLSALKAGDEVITTGGMLGKIDSITDNIIEIVISEGVKVRVQKSAIVGTLPKGTLQV